MSPPSVRAGAGRGTSSSGPPGAGWAGPVIAATFILGGLLVILFPWHTGTIVRVMVVTIVAAAAVSALLANLPERGAGGWWMSPFTRLAPRPGPGPRVEDLDRIREKLTGRRRSLPHGPPLPPETIRLLEGLVRDGLDRAGVDPDPDDPDVESLPPRIRAVLGSAGGDVRPRLIRPDDRQVAGAVHQVLDDLEILTGRSTSAPPLPDPHVP